MEQLDQVNRASAQVQSPAGVCDVGLDLLDERFDPVEGDLARVLSVLQQGLADPAHAEFVQKLEQARNPGS